MIVYMGNEVFGVKWRNWKLNFKEQDTIFSETRTYGTPRVYNCSPIRARAKTCYSHTLGFPKRTLLTSASTPHRLQKEPPIKPGALDPHQPSSGK